MRAHWLVSQCLVVGDQQPFIAALVTIDPESFPTWLEQNGRPADTPLADLHRRPGPAGRDPGRDRRRQQGGQQGGVDPQVHHPADDWTEAGGQLTPSLKLKRNVVNKERANEIADLYT